MSAVSGKPMEVFPDLHHKMSKKIAQLTKVIYHLNTKNEDHAMEVEQLVSNHQMEIQQILRDAANRISKFKDVVEAKQQAASQDVKIEKLTKKHEQEKAQAQQELASLKQRMSERENKIADAFQSKYDLLRKEVDTMNKKFQERIASFESVNQELKKTLDDTASSGNQGLEALKKKHEQEIAEVVRSSNDKYNALLIEQLGIQESLKKEAAVRLSAELQALSDKEKAERERENGQIRAKLAAEKQEALLALRHDLEDKLNSLKSESAGKMDKLLADVLAKSKELEEERERARERLAERDKEIERLSLALRDQQGGSETAISTLSAELQSLKEQLKSSAARLQTERDSNASLQSLVSEKNAKIASLETAQEQLQETLRRLQGELEHARDGATQQEQDLSKRLQVSERESESYRNEINSMAQQLLALREDSKALSKQHAQAITELQTQLDALAREKTLLDSRLRDAEQSSSSLSAQAAQELAALRDELSSRERLFKEREDALQSEFSQKTHAMQTKHAEEIAQRDRKAQDKDAEHATALRTKSEEFEEFKRVAAAQRESESERETREREERERAFAERESALKSAVDELSAQLATSSDGAEREKTRLQGELTKLEGKYKALSKELESKRGDNERFESLTSSLKTQIENLREELKASQKAFREKLDIDAQRLEREWEQRMSAALAEKDRERESERLALQSGFASERESLCAQHGDEIQALKAMLQKEASDSAATLREIERSREALEAMLQSERGAHSLSLSEMSSAHTATLRDKDDTHAREMDRLRRELRSASDAAVAQLTAQHDDAAQQWQRLLAATKEEHRTELESSLHAAQTAAKEELRKSLKSQEEALNAEGKRERDALHAEKEKEKALLLAAHEKERDALQADLRDNKLALQDSKSQIVALQDIINSERATRSRREEEFIREKDSLQRENQQTLRTQQEEHEKQSLAIMKRSEDDLHAAKRETADQKTVFEDRIREIVKEYKALENKYLNRESRPEDLAQIEQLTNEIAEKEELVKKIQEEMVYFKRELLNREENFNQKFSRQPNVGVMQVIKPKEASDGKAKPTQMRVINTQGGNLGMPGMGLGVGLGVGTSSAKAKK